MVTLPRTDRYTIIILLSELTKYYDILSVPVQVLEPEDPMSHLVTYLLECFGRLREIHVGLIRGMYIEDHFKMDYDLQVRYRVDYFIAKQAYEKQLALRVRYTTILNQP